MTVGPGFAVICRMRVTAIESGRGSKKTDAGFALGNRFDDVESRSYAFDPATAPREAPDSEDSDPA
jgi:hypothetical protein